MMKPDNELIAEFMKSDAVNSPHLKKKEDLEYHYSWDWLMPVVEKIEAIYDNHHGYFGIHINSNSCTVQGTNFRSDKVSQPLVIFYQEYGSTKIEATHKAVVDFIKWYNQTQ